MNSLEQNRTTEFNLFKTISNIDKPISPFKKVYEELITDPVFDNFNPKILSLVVSYMMIKYMLFTLPFKEMIGNHLETIKGILNKKPENLENEVDLLISEYIKLVVNKSAEDELINGHAVTHIYLPKEMSKLNTDQLIREEIVRKLNNATNKDKIPVHSVFSFKEANRALKDMLTDPYFYQIMVQKKALGSQRTYNNKKTYTADTRFGNKKIKDLESDGVTIVLELSNQATHVVIRTIYPNMSMKKIKDGLKEPIDSQYGYVA